jgi:peroxiredoxin
VLALLLIASCAGGRQQRRATRSPYDLVLQTTSGGRFDFSSLQGEVAIVTFFATWCFPCLIDTKTLSALQHRFEQQGVQVVAVGMDLEGRTVLEPFAKSAEVPYPVLVASEEVREGDTPYGRITELPTTFLLDRRGKLAAAWTGPIEPAAIEKAVSELIER